MELTNQNKSNYISGLFLFLVSPIFSLFYSLKNYEDKASKYLLWFFVAYLGYSFQIPDAYIGDAVRYREHFYEHIAKNKSIADLFGSLFADSQNLELIERLISVSVGKFTDNFHFLFLAYGVVFGFFFSNNISYLYKKVQKEKLKYTLFLTIALFFIIPPWYINGFDFWCASQVFIFGMLPYLIDNNKKNLIFILLSPLVHFSFYIIIFLSAVFLFIKNKDKLIFYFFCLSFLFVYGLSPSSFAGIIETFLPESIVRRSNAYINPIEVVHQGGRIVGTVRWLYSISLNIIIVYVYIKYKSLILENANLKRMFLYTFFIIGCFNTLSVIPSVSRFLLIGRWFVLSTLFVLMYTKDMDRKHLYTAFSKIKPIVILYCFFEFLRTLLPIMGVGSILSNVFFVNQFIEDDLIIGNVMNFIN